ncbi:MAG: hypothetical protein AAFO86_07685 [Pseudomonadota bacterium]
MSEPSTLCLSMVLHPTSFEAWRNATLAAPETWDDWDVLDPQPQDFVLWNRLGQVRVATVIDDILEQGRQDGTVLERSAEGRIDLVALLTSQNWREQILILGAVRMLEGFGGTDGWALMHDYVFGQSGTAWCVRFPIWGRSELHADAPAGIKAQADALVLPFLETARARRD